MFSVKIIPVSKKESSYDLWQETKTTEKIGPYKASHSPPIRLWIISIVLCIGTAFPAYLGLYFPNNARPNIQQHFARSFDVQRLSTNETTNETENLDSLSNSEEMDHIWSAYVVLGTAALTLGKIPAPVFDQQMGRRRCLLFFTIIAVLTQLLELLSQPLGQVFLSFLGRALSLFCFGVTTTVTPVFLSEIAPSSIRGSISVLYPLTLSIGTTMSAVMGLPPVLGREHLWFFSFLVPIICCVFVVPVLFYIPDTPHCIGRRLGAIPGEHLMKNALMFYHGNLSSYKTLQETSLVSKQKKVSIIKNFQLYWKIMTSASLRPQFFISLALAGAYCFSGLTVLNLHSRSIFTSAGIEYAEYCTIGLHVLGITLFFMCFFLVDKLGRRPLLLISCTGGLIGWVLLVFTYFVPQSISWKPYLVLVLMIIVQLSVNIGIRPLFFPVIPEIFPTETRTSALALAGLITGLMQIPVLYLIIPLLGLIGVLTFIMLAIPLLICTVFFYLKFPETKGKDFAEIEF